MYPGAIKDASEVLVPQIVLPSSMPHSMYASCLLEEGIQLSAPYMALQSPDWWTARRSHLIGGQNGAVTWLVDNMLQSLHYGQEDTVLC